MELRDLYNPGAMMRRLLAVLLAVTGVGCATSRSVSPPGGGTEHEISCGYFGWYICYDRATQICQGDFKVISENEGPGGRQLRIACQRRP